ncbi:MAG: HAD family phosphatase [Rhodoferax sp.]|nr:HAD family phosphatase [Rhodoferax sp.]
MAPVSRPVAALIFDIDGTMIDSMGHHRQSWIDFTLRHGLRIDVDDLMRRTTGRTGAECMPELFGRPFAPEEARALVDEKESMYREAFGPVFREVSGFTEFQHLGRQRGLKIGVGTAGDRHNIAFVFGHLRLPQAPHAVVGGDEGLPGKPEPAIFLEAARRMGVAPEACIVFEDAPLGIEAARRAGMQAVGLCTSFTPEQLAGPHVLHRVSDYRELIRTGFLETLDVALC